MTPPESARDAPAHIHPHMYRPCPDQGPHVCADCPLGEHNAVHHLLPALDVPERYEVERPDTVPRERQCFRCGQTRPVFPWAEPIDDSIQRTEAELDQAIRDSIQPACARCWSHLEGRSS